MANNLTNEATAGYQANETDRNPFLSSSPCAIAWDVGRWLRVTSRSAPRNVKMSRGYTVRANDMLIKWLGDGKCERIN